MLKSFFIKSFFVCSLLLITLPTYTAEENNFPIVPQNFLSNLISNTIGFGFLSRIFAGEAIKEQNEAKKKQRHKEIEQEFETYGFSIVQMPERKIFFVIETETVYFLKSHKQSYENGLNPFLSTPLTALVISYTIIGGSEKDGSGSIEEVTQNLRAFRQGFKHKELEKEFYKLHGQKMLIK